MLHRRQFLTLSALGLVGCRICAAREALAKQRPRGCVLHGQSVDALGVQRYVASGDSEDQLIETSGDPTMDKYLGRALVRIATTFQVDPGFGFFDDSDSENAYATPDTKVAGTHGTVLFGLTLFHDILSSYNDAGMAVVAVCSHEFAHIYQFGTEHYEKLSKLDTTAKPVELHADFMAGYYLSTRKAEYPDLNLQGAGQLINAFGDTAFNDPDHHGTPKERVASIEGGYSFGRQNKVPVHQVADAGAEFILQFM